MTYKGEFENDMYEGIGEEYINTALKYKGNWVKGQKQGQGVEYISTHVNFTGQFVQGYIDGLGIVTCQNRGRIIEGNFKYDGTGIGTCKIDSFYLNNKAFPVVYTG